MSEAETVHVPVLLDEVLASLDVRPGDVVLDGTLGLGGHAEAILKRIVPGGTLIGLDVHEESLERATARLSMFGGSFRGLQGNFAEFVPLAKAVGVEEFDEILVDLGISSVQLSDPELGLSFSRDMPLTMAYGGGSGETAADVVNKMPEREIAHILKTYGEESRAYAIAKAIVRRRASGPIRTTGELAELVASVAPRWDKDPATKCFLALRVYVNSEMENLDRFLEQLPGRLKPGGRAAIIAYHSLEDARVKAAFRRLVARSGESGDYTLITPKPIRPTAEEVARNPRSRSAVMRCIAYKLGHD